MRESVVLLDSLRALANHKIQILESKYWNKVNPPPFTWKDESIKGVAWRANVGALRNERTNLVRFGIRGQPDIEGMFRGGQRFGLECKKASTKRSKYQTWYHDFFGGLGMWIAVVRSYEDAEKVLKGWGL